MVTPETTAQEIDSHLRARSGEEDIRLHTESITTLPVKKTSFFLTTTSLFLLLLADCGVARAQEKGESLVSPPASSCGSEEFQDALEQLREWRYSDPEEVVFFLSGKTSWSKDEITQLMNTVPHMHIMQIEALAHHVIPQLPVEMIGHAKEIFIKAVETREFDDSRIRPYPLMFDEFAEAITKRELDNRDVPTSTYLYLSFVREYRCLITDNWKSKIDRYLPLVYAQQTLDDLRFATDRVDRILHAAENFEDYIAPFTSIVKRLENLGRIFYKKDAEQLNSPKGIWHSNWGFSEREIMALLDEYAVRLHRTHPSDNVISKCLLDYLESYVTYGENLKRSGISSEEVIKAVVERLFKDPILCGNTKHLEKFLSLHDDPQLIVSTLAEGLSSIDEDEYLAMRARTRIIKNLHRGLSRIEQRSSSYEYASFVKTEVFKFIACELDKQFAEPDMEYEKRLILTSNESYEYYHLAEIFDMFMVLHKRGLDLDNPQLVELAKRFIEEHRKIICLPPEHELPLGMEVDIRATTKLSLVAAKELNITSSEQRLVHLSIKEILQSCSTSSCSSFRNSKHYKYCEALAYLYKLHKRKALSDHVVSRYSSYIAYLASSTDLSSGAKLCKLRDKLKDRIRMQPTRLPKSSSNFLDIRKSDDDPYGLLDDIPWWFENWKIAYTLAASALISLTGQLLSQHSRSKAQEKRKRELRKRYRSNVEESSVNQ